MKEPIYKFQKNVDNLGRIVIPKIIVNKLGKQYILEFYEDKIILKPIKKEQYSGR